MSYEAKLKELRDRRTRLWNESQEILRRAEAEKRETLTAEEDTNWRKAHEDMNSLDAEIERYEEQRRRDEEMGRSQGVRVGKPDSDGTEDRVGAGETETPEEREKAYASAFGSFLRYGMRGLSTEQRQVMLQKAVDLSPEQRAQGVATDVGGGFLVPQGFYAQVVSARQRYGGMRRSRATVLNTTTGEDLPIPTDNDTGNTGALLAENTQVTEQDVTVGQVVLRSYTYTSRLVRVSLKLLRDSAFNIDSWLSMKLGERIGRILNTHFTTGDGASKPHGVVPMATLGVTGASATSITLDELYSLKHSVNPDYRDAAEWMFNDSSLLKIKQLKDGDGRTLWQPGMADGSPNTIDGDSYVVNQQMASMAADAKSVLYGDFANYFIRDVGGITLLRLEERYADYLQVGFLAFSDHDGVLVDAGTNPIKYFQNAS